MQATNTVPFWMFNLEDINSFDSNRFFLQLEDEISL